MKKIKESIALVTVILFIVGAISLLSYRLIVSPILEGYHKYGWSGAAIAIIIEIVIYTIIYFIIKFIWWAIETVFENE